MSPPDLSPSERPANNADDPTAWSPYEHHEDPDEIPHDVIGILALGIALMAILTAVMWISVGPVAAAVTGGIAAIWAVIRLTRRAHRERREELTLPSKDLVERAPPPGHHGSWPPPVPPA
jgi:Flp pilus assembly protein TadB